MLAQYEIIYETTWLKLFRLAQTIQNQLPINPSIDLRIKSHEKLLSQVALFDLVKIERENNKSFKCWLIDKYHLDPDELVRNLFVLQWIRHPFHDNLPFEPHMIEYICSKPKAKQILKSLFKNLNPYNFNLMNHSPPFSIPTINEKLFLFLLENYQHYMPGTHPIFWALLNEDIHLLEKIIKSMPCCLNEVNMNSETPLMLAIRNQNEDILLKILAFKPEIIVINSKRETIAHILCQTDNSDWLIKLINDPAFEQLKIQEMILDPSLIDTKDQIPLCHAVLKGHHNVVSSFIQLKPELKKALFVCYYQAIEKQEHFLLSSLFHDYALNFFEIPELTTSFVLNAIHFRNEKALRWLLDLPLMERSFRNAALFYNGIVNDRFNVSKTSLRSFEIHWEKVPYQICFKMTTALLQKKQSKLIASLSLFDLHPHFHSYLCPIGQKTNNFLDFLDLHPSLNPDPVFVNYFLEYLEVNSDSYPFWLLDFHQDLLKVLDILNIEKNILVHGQPLLFFIENYGFNHYTLEKRTEILKAFLTDSVLIDVKNFNGQHIFAHLLTRDANHGIHRIQLLKKVNSKFSLENLDSCGSNLLHLAVETSNLEAIRWCFNQNIDVEATRSSDHLSSVQLIIDSGNMKIFEILLKRIKKSSFFCFIETLINQKKDELLQFIFTQDKPFSWSLTDFHFSQIKILEHPIIQALFNPKPKEEPVIAKEPTPNPITIAEPLPKKTKPVLITMNMKNLVHLIESKNHKQFEYLIEEQYQDELCKIFDENFQNILIMVFNSDCKKLNKIFIRIPAAIQEINKKDTWNQLCLYALEHCNIQIIENMIGREVILIELKSRLMELYHFAMLHHPKFWAEHLFKLLPINSQESQTLFQLAVDSENSEALKMFLAHKKTRQHFVDAALPVWNEILKKEAILLKSCLIYPEIEQALILNLSACYFLALQKNESFVQETLLSFSSIRKKILELGQEYLQKLLEAGFEKQVLPALASHQELATLTRPFFPVKEMLLPTFIQNAFSVSFSGQNTLYLVGSAIHLILGLTSIDNLNDIDFISTTPPSEKTIYKQSKVQPQLYFTSLLIKADKQLKLEYFVSRQTDSFFISQDYLNRDFTVNALYCDRNGKIYDPSNMGLYDLENKKIRSIKDPVISFHHHPIRLLRAIRLMIKGFQLTPEVESAMLSWEPPKDIVHYGHLFSMASQMLFSQNAQQIYSLLVRFDLIYKLLNCSREAPLSIVQETVSSEANRYKHTNSPTLKK